MVQLNIFEMDPAKSILLTTCTFPEKSTSLYISPGINQLFVTTHQNYAHPPCIVQWDLTDAYKTDLCHLLCSLKYINLSGNQVVKLRY